MVKASECNSKGHEFNARLRVRVYKHIFLYLSNARVKLICLCAWRLSSFFVIFIPFSYSFCFIYTQFFLCFFFLLPSLMLPLGLTGTEFAIPSACFYLSLSLFLFFRFSKICFHVRRRLVSSSYNNLSQPSALGELPGGSP